MSRGAAAVASAASEAGVGLRPAVNPDIFPGGFEQAHGVVWTAAAIRSEHFPLSSITDGHGDARTSRLQVMVTSTMPAPDCPSTSGCRGCPGIFFMLSSICWACLPGRRWRLHHGVVLRMGWMRSREPEGFDRRHFERRIKVRNELAHEGPVSNTTAARRGAWFFGLVALGWRNCGDLAHPMRDPHPSAKMGRQGLRSFRGRCG